MIQQQARAKAIVGEFQELLRSPPGRAFVKEFKKQFDVPVKALGDAHQTVIHAAQGDCVRWIEDMLEYDLTEDVTDGT